VAEEVSLQRASQMHDLAISRSFKRVCRAELMLAAGAPTAHPLTAHALPDHPIVTNWLTDNSLLEACGPKADWLCPCSCICMMQ